MRLANVVLVIAASFWPAAAQAVEVKLGAETQAVYDSNVFRTSENKKDDFSFRFAPTIQIDEKTDRLGASLFYRPMYEAFATYTDANELSHFLQSNLTYRFSDRTHAELRNNFSVQYVLNLDDPDTIDEGSNQAPDNDITRDEMFLFDSTLNVSHALSPRWESNSEVAFKLFDPRERRQSVASNTVSAFQTFQYTRDPSNIFGAGGGAVVQMFDEIATIPASNTYIFRLFASYTRHFGESTTLSVRVGPGLLVTRQDDADDDTSSTYPFTSVPKDTTVRELVDQGLMIDLEQPFQDIDLDTVVPAGSVIVPNPLKCVSDDPLNSFAVRVLYTGGDCTQHEILFRNDPSLEDPNLNDEFDAFEIIRNDTQEIRIAGSDSGSNDSTFTWFGDVSLTHRWTPQLFSTLSYNRSESTANGQGTSTIADTVSFLTVWRPDPLWDLSLRGSYVKRVAPNEVSQTFAWAKRDTPGEATGGLVKLTGESLVVEDSRSVDTERWDVRLRVARRVTRHITVSAWTGYSDQRSKDTSRNPNDFGNFTAILGFKYDFDPFRF